MFTASLQAQVLSNQRKKWFYPASDTIRLDTLSIIPGSLLVHDRKFNSLDSSYYKTDFINGFLILKNRKNISHGDSLLILWRVFPFSFAKNFRHKDISLIVPGSGEVANPFIYPASGKPMEDFFSSRGLTKNGSISRGITFGNNQDVTVNSNMNIELSGKLSENIEILAAITDNNIPFQPEGNTQQIQEFDKVFIQLSDGQTKLIAGDFELRRPKSYFMNFYKKVQGAGLSTRLVEKEKQHVTVTSEANIAVSKGKYARNISSGSKFNGAEQEGNQGPYKLRGAENESFIIVLSGTERIYIDGKRLVRGQENDYIIDYNSAEISFTPAQVITKDKRLVVEFEYSERNYTRSLVFTGGTVKKNNLELRLHLFSEQDARNQPLLQDLDDEQKNIMKNAGDDLNAAIAPSADSVGYSANVVLYKKTDTLIFYPAQNKYFIFKDVYIWSFDPDSAFYSLAFSYVGEGNGNYAQVSSTVNGKVYAWKAPLLNADGSFTSSGSFEPVIKLVTPKKKQMAVIGADYFISGNSVFTYESAISNNDLNTFSAVGNDDNTGYAHRFALKNKSDVSLKTSLETSVSYENKGKTFLPPERYRAVEFERDWNITGTSALSDEHLLGGDISLKNGKGNLLKYGLQSFIRGDGYRGIRNALGGNGTASGFSVSADGSLLNSAGTGNFSRFLRHKILLTKRIKALSIGIKEETEENVIGIPGSDSLLTGGFAFFQREFFIASADTASTQYNLTWKNRTDRLPYRGRNEPVTNADDINLSAMFLENPKNQLKTSINYRQLKILDTLLTSLKPGNTVLGRIEYYLRILKNSVSLATFYEIGTGQEYKKDFYYIKVAPGDGIYTWQDYNGNGREDLIEFPLAAFKDKAEYLRIYTPTSQLVSTRINLFNQTLDLRPVMIWNNKKGIKKFLTRFSNQSAYRMDKKTMMENFYLAYNPFQVNIADTALVTMNYSFRNTLYFNRTDPVYGVDLNYQANRGKSFLVNGFDSRSNEYWGGKVRTTAGRTVTLFLSYTNGSKQSFSEYLATRNYRLAYFDLMPEAVYQQGPKMRVKGWWKYSEKRNGFFPDGSGGERGYLNTIGIEIKRSAAGKGFLEAQANYIDIIYRYPENSPVAYEILQGLRPGQNITWTVSWQQNLSDHIQMGLSYTGRKSEDTDAVHTGSVQMRAFF